MELLILIILATIFYALFGIFTSRASGAIDANLSAVIFNGLGSVIPLLTYIFLKFIKGTKLIAISVPGIIYSILAGVAIAIFSVLLVKIFEKGGLAYVMPLIYGGIVVLGSLSGWLIFKESVSFLQIIGIAVIIVGIIIVIISKLQTSVI